MKKVRVVKNFVNSNEILLLNKWSLQNYKNNPGDYMDANMDSIRPRTRFTTRLENSRNHHNERISIDYPEEAYTIRDRIKNKFGLWNYESPPSFVDGIVNGIGFGEGAIDEHIDPVYYPNTHTLHCNVISQKSDSGGVTIIGGEEYDVNVGDLLCYVVSDVKHRVTVTKGKTNRILWVYGFCISSYKMEEIFYEKFSI